MIRNATRPRRWLGYAAAALFLVGGLAARPVAASAVIDLPITNSNYAVAFFQVEAFGQTFTAPQDTLREFTFYGASASVASQTFIIAPWSTSGAGAAIFTKAVTLSTDARESLTVNTGTLELIPGKQYIAYFSNIRGSLSATGNASNSADAYPAGTVIYKSGGVWGSDIGGAPGPLDLAFRARFTNDADNDGVEDDLDMCPNSDMRSIVDVDGARTGDTGIKNVVDALGCTIQDYVNAAQTSAKNKGQYEKSIQGIAYDLVRRGTITTAQQKEMKQDAAQSIFGKK